MRNRHKHRLTFRGVQHLHWARGYPETLILWACECGKSHTETRRGIWTAEQLAPKKKAA